MSVGLAKIVRGRFLALIFHTGATTTLFFAKASLIQLQLDFEMDFRQTLVDYERIDTWMTNLLTLTLLLMGVEFAALFSGYMVHQRIANALSALAHLGGFLATLSMVVNGWTVRVYMGIFVLCSLVPAGFEILWWTFQIFVRRSRPA